MSDVWRDASYLDIRFTQSQPKFPYLSAQSSAPHDGTATAPNTKLIKKCTADRPGPAPCQMPDRLLPPVATSGSSGLICPDASQHRFGNRTTRCPLKAMKECTHNWNKPNIVGKCARCFFDIHFRTVLSMTEFLLRL